MNRLLLLGPREKIKDITAIGGAVVLFEQLISDLEKKGVDFCIINTNIMKSSLLIFVAYFVIVSKLLLKIKKYDHISLHASTRGVIYLATVVTLISKIFNRRISLRKFAGDFPETFESSNFIKKNMMKYVLQKCDIIFLETKYLVDYFSKFNNNIVWFPNVRKRKLSPKIPRDFNKRFVFISQVKKTKGVYEILKVSKLLDDNYTIDIYGPIIDKDINKDDFINYNVTYKGPLQYEDVIPTLNSYDVLLLPTYYEGEGYPGIIIESYSLGIPVITTNWKSIPEIVDNYKTGIMIKPGNVDELKNAVEYFNKKNYCEFSKNADKAFNKFDSDNQTELYLKKINE